jgi:fructoselysine 6-kinase
MLNIAFVGDLTVDIYPQKNKMNLGGSSLTSALWAKKFGVGVSILGAVGNDKAGEEYKKMFKKNGLSLDYLKTLNSETSSIEIFLDKDGEHTYGQWNAGAYVSYHLGEKELEFLKTEDAVVLPVYFKTRHLLAEVVKIKQPKPILVVDFDDLSQFGKSCAIIKEHLKYIDIVKIGLDREKDAELMKELQKLKVLTVVTLGSSGSVAFQNGKTYIQKTKKIKTKNTTGAGDVFLAGFLVEWMKTKDIIKSLSQANGFCLEYLSQHRYESA